MRKHHIKFHFLEWETFIGQCLDCHGAKERSKNFLNNTDSDSQCLDECKNQTDATGCVHAGSGACYKYVVEVSAGNNVTTNPPYKCWVRPGNCKGNSD